MKSYNMSYTDMHIHTTESDGELSVKSIFQRAAELGLEAICISDHDSFEHFEEVFDYANDFNIDTIPAVEVSTVYNDKEIHILAYGVGKAHKMFNHQLLRIREDREQRAERIILNLKKYYGLEIDFDNVKKRAKQNIGRPHIAKELMAKSYVKSISEAFNKYLNQSSKAFVSKYRINTDRAIEMIKIAGGVSVLAHIGRYYSLKMLDNFRKYGLYGLELYHPSHDENIREELEKYSAKHGMLLSGGSDFHGGNMDSEDLGSQKVPIEFYYKIKNIIKVKNGR